jgi:hypothetical protein
MKDWQKNIIAGGVGAGVGAGTYGVIGGVGIAALGGAAGVTLGPFIAIGAGIGFAGHGLYWLGKQIGGRKKKID